MSGLVDERLFFLLAYLPKEIVDFVEEKCAILTIDDDDREYASHWDLDSFVFKNKTCLIILNANIWKKKGPSLVMAVAHEVAHAYLRHKIRVPENQWLRNERAADKQAIAWLKPHWKKQRLIKFAFYLNHKYDKGHLLIPRKRSGFKNEY